ncbi:hemolymph lipopolysaccharide-binding protein isoform X1 [Hylaeus anthracinus]|uniref:hemolymph lipopolysaccharide-binding protein isoform X1 n=1 Tax=Hylaeus anthracinus TaxID=313031 RepID=UPI0023BA2919|nr:hemolymph lipopolysaccharide-binding protein isoform X1 [Hylaeus anthracinus]
MLDKLLILLVFTSDIFGFVMPDAIETFAETGIDTGLHLIGNQTRILLDKSPKPPPRTYKDGFSGSQPPVITMNGQNNYQAGQQTFYAERSSGYNCDKCNRSCTNVLKRGDYIVTPGIGAHKLHTRKQNWNVARKACMDEGGYLAVPNSLDEETVLLKWLQAAKVDRAWLGIHDLFEEGEWVTVTGESLEKSGYDRWTPAIPGDPDNAGGHQNCAILMGEHGGMDDIQCESLFFYFCEITMC